MALVLGTNCGFVLTAPLADPEATNFTADQFVVAGKFTAPSGDNIITEIGCYVDDATEAANMEVGIYSHDADANEPDVLLASGSMVKGTTSGWKSATVNYNLTSGQIYWLAEVLDDTLTVTNLNYTATFGELQHIYSKETPLDNPWTGSTETNANLFAIYGLYVVVNDPNAALPSDPGLEADNVLMKIPGWQNIRDQLKRRGGGRGHESKRTFKVY